MKSKLIATLAAVLITILMGLPVGVQAQDQDDQPQVQDQYPQDQGPAPQDQAPAPQDQAPAQEQPQSSVARVSFIHGDVSHQRGDTNEWSAASLNAPVVAGDNIATGDRARTELELDYADILRLDEHTQANIVNLSRNQIQIQLSQGEANYSVLKNGEADTEIDTPNVAVRPTHNGGSYRIEVISDQETRVIARRGDADVSTPQGSTHLESGEMMTIRGAGNDTQYRIADAPGRDDWDNWNSDRDHKIQSAHSWQNTNRYYTGSEDLDAYGQWRDVPDYGRVWVPAAAPGWTPYSDGQWVWEPYWGWTWTSYEPWGWAPYHYGRWMYLDGSWGWWPGPVYGGGFYRPIWAPAYVSFFGFGGGVGFGVGFGWGSIGWLPLGPCDSFFPWWGGYRSSFNVVNITNITNINNIHGGLPPLRTGNTRFSNVWMASHNNNFRRAISTVPANDFGRGHIRPTPVTGEQFRNGRMATGNLPVVPNRQSLSASGRPAAASTLARSTRPTHFFSTARPSAGARPSFEQERGQLQSAIQRSGHPVIGGRENGAVAARPGMNNNRENAGGVNNRPGMNNNRQTAGMENGRQGINNGREGGGVASNGRPSIGNERMGTQPNSRGPMNNQNAENRGANANPRGSVETNNARPTSPNSGWQRFGTPRPPTSSGPATGGFRGNGSQPNSMPARQPNAGSVRNESGPGARPQSNSGGWQTFSRPSSSAPAARPGSSAPAPMNRGSVAPMNRPAQESVQAQNRSNDGWHQFTPRPSGSQSAQPSRPIGSAPPRSNSPVWSERPPAPSRNAGPSGGYSRPPLNMRQPIVSPRNSAPSSPRYSAPPSSSPRYSAPPSSGQRYSAPPSSGPRYSAPPSSSPRYSAPSAPRYSPPSGGGYRGAPLGGGYRGAPSGGGYHGAPSGGGHSAPSGGGHSAPSGGGSHGGGGSHSNGHH